MISCAVYKSAFSLGWRYRVLTTPALFSNTQRANKTQEEGGGGEGRIIGMLGQGNENEHRSTRPTYVDKNK